MDCLVDTHIALWALLEPERLSEGARQVLADPGSVKYVSHVSVWEVAIKHLSHPDRMPMPAAAFASSCEKAGFRLCAPELESIIGTEKLPFGDDVAGGRKDPFDRLLVSQAQHGGMRFVTHDGRIALYGLPFVMLV